VCAGQGGCTFVLEKVPAKGTRCGQDQWNYAFGRFLPTNLLISATHTATN